MGNRSFPDRVILCSQCKVTERSAEVVLAVAKYKDAWKK
jgi:hypothetical protein